MQKELGRIQDFAAKQSTRDEIKVKIKNYLWDDKTGLPESFDPGEVEEKTDAVYTHILVQSRVSFGHITDYATS